MHIYHLLPDCHMRLMMAHDASKPVLVHVMQQMPSVSLQTADQQKLLQRQQEVPEGGLRCGHSRTSITPCGPLKPSQVMRCKPMMHTLYAALFTVNVMSKHYILDGSPILLDLISESIQASIDGLTCTQW